MTTEYVIAPDWCTFENHSWYWSSRSPHREGFAWMTREDWELFDAIVRRRRNEPEPIYSVFVYYVADVLR